MKRKFFLLFCCALAGAAGKHGKTGKTAGAWDARLRSYTGSVLVRPAGGKNWANARQGLPLSRGDVVRTGKKSTADISLDGRGLASLGAAAEFELKDLRHRDSGFALKAGRLIMKVTGLKLRAEVLSVRTPTAVAAVRGTEFGVEFDKDRAETLVNVFEEGEVQVTSLDENGNPVGEAITVIPHHEVRVRKEMEAMSLAQSPESRYRDPAISTVRKKLGALEKTYEPLPGKQREEEREQTFGRKGPGGSAAARGGQDPEDAGGAAARKKDGDGGAVKGGKKHGEAGAGKYGAAAAGEGGGDDELKLKGGLAGHGGKGGKGGRGGKGGKGDDDGLPRIKAAADGAGQGGGSKAGAAGSLLGPDADETVSRPTSSTDKSVGTIVSRVQTKLAATGNDGAISDSELRAMVISAAKSTNSDASFLTALNTSLAERLSAGDTPALQTSVISAPKTVAPTTLTSPIAITNPAITSPVLTNTTTGAVIKKK